MTNVTFITGNQNKADYLAKLLNHKIDHARLELDELQSLDLKEIVEHKTRQAYAKLKRPVLTDDVSLEFQALGHLPGPFVKFFEQELGLEKVCRLLDSFVSREAIAICGMGYYDGQQYKYFENSLKGRIAKSPIGDGGFGFDKIFIPEGYGVTRAQMNPEDDKKTYLTIKPIEQVKEFLAGLDKKQT